VGIEFVSISNGLFFVRATKNVDLANELEISKALTYMKMKDIKKAIETLKVYFRSKQVNNSWN
jgi:hypothetical protein